MDKVNNKISEWFMAVVNFVFRMNMMILLLFLMGIAIILFTIYSISLVAFGFSLGVVLIGLSLLLLNAS